MANQFIYVYSTFVFRNGTYSEGVNENNTAKLAAQFNEKEIGFYMGTLSDDINKRTQELAELTGLDNVSVTKGNGFSMDICQNGKKIANFKIDVSVDEGHENDLLLNGDPASKLTEYDWEDFENLTNYIS